MSTEKKEKKSIIDLYREDPRLAVVGMLLAGLTVVSGVVGKLYADSISDKGRIISEVSQLRFERDSVIRKGQQDLTECQNRYIAEIKAFNDEIKEYYERQLEVNKSASATLNKATRAVTQTTDKLKQLDEN